MAVETLKREHVANVIFPGPKNTQLMKLPIQALKVHPERQRELHAAKVLKMFQARGGFDEELAGFLDVAEDSDAPGSYWIVAGQHRKAVAEMAQVSHVWCLVHLNMTPQEQARFYLGTTLSTNPSPLEAWVVRRTAGDVDVIQTEQVLTRYDIRVMYSNGSSRTLVAVRALETVIFRGGYERLDKLLRLTIAAYPLGTPLQDWWLLGMEMLLWAYENDPLFDEERLIYALKRTDPLTIRRRGRFYMAELGKNQDGHPGQSAPAAKLFARSLLDAYNFGLRTRRLSEIRLDMPRSRKSVAGVPANPFAPVPSVPDEKL